MNKIISPFSLSRTMHDLLQESLFLKPFLEISFLFFFVQTSSMIFPNCSITGYCNSQYLKQHWHNS